MPRPKVHPNNRQRAAEACDFCRISKKRCSATVPCANCIKRGIADSCHLSRTAKDARTLRPPPFRPSQAQPNPTNGVNGAYQDVGPITSPNSSTSLGPPASHVSNGLKASSLPTPPQSLSTNTIVARDDASSVDRRSSFGAEVHSRMLLNRSGDRMFIGESASISFLQIVRDTVSAKLGPSQFSHNDSVDKMLEAQTAPYNESCPSPDFFSDECSSYFDVYCAATSGLIDLLSPGEYAYLCRTGAEVEPSTPVINPIVRDLVLAIGAQCLSPMSSRNAGERYFRRAQLAAFSTMLEDPSIDMIRIFVLMSIYMLGQCRRNTAYMYLGIAARAGTAIGLHSGGEYSNAADQESQMRGRVWMSLCNVDILSGSILGRPPATNGLRLDPDKNCGYEKEHATVESTPIMASSQILVVINEIVDRIYVNKDNSIETAEELLERVEKWSRRLPKSLSRGRDSALQTTQKESIAEMHISCLYYYAVTLITRPVLIAALTSESGTASSQLALACLDAAIFLVQTCVNVYDQGLLTGNMCFIKALVFASGLILGFALFVEQKDDQELYGAFEGASTVLSFLSKQSPQAAHYYDILSLLSQAIASKRQKQACRGRSKYVGKLFSREEEPQEQMASAQAGQNDGFMSEAQMGIDETILPLTSDAMPLDLSGVDVELPFDWDILEIAQWDNFPCFEQRGNRVDGWVEDLMSR